MTHRPAADPLPKWRSVLVVVAHPDDESFGLGALLGRFIGDGGSVAALCFTHGESSTLHGVEGDLEQVRVQELAAAGQALGVAPIELLSYRDGQLDDVPLEELSSHIVQLVHEVSADGLLVFDTDGVTGHPDHIQATAAAVHAADQVGLPVLGWTVPSAIAAELNQEYGTAFSGRDASDIDAVVPVDRTLQYTAIRCHPSQALPSSVLWRRLELLGGQEHIRWIRRQAAGPIVEGAIT